MLRWQRLYLCPMSPLLTVLWDKALNCGCLGTTWGSTWTAVRAVQATLLPLPVLPLLKFPSNDLPTAISMPVNHIAHMR